VEQLCTSAFVISDRFNTQECMFLLDWFTNFESFYGSMIAYQIGNVSLLGDRSGVSRSF